MSAEVALVTGGAQRIGRAIVLALVEAGYAVGVHCRHSRQEAETLVARIRQEGGRAETVQGNLMLPVADDLIAQTAAALGPVTLLVNNASIFERDSISTLELRQFERNLQVNLKAPVMLAQAFAKALPKDADGAIVNLIDQRVLRPSPEFFSYMLAKSALWTATRTLALALAPRIRVNGIGPGPVLPNTLEGDDGFAREIAATPLRRQVRPEEIAATVVFLARARNVTGQMIAVDAGQHLG